MIESEAGEVIGSVETARAHGAVHDGSVYLHMGRSYLVEHLDLDNRRALVTPFSGDFYTQSKRETDTFIEEVVDRREVADCLLSFGTVNVTEQVTGYQRKRVSDHEVLDLVALDMPEQHFTTQALWWEMPEQALADDFPLDVLQGSLHAAEHAQIAVLPLIAMCDRWDIGGLSTAFHSQTGRPTVFVYDGHPGGVGITRVGYEQFERLVANATALCLGVPVPSRLPLLRAVAQVRQPQRAAEQERRGGAAAATGVVTHPHLQALQVRQRRAENVGDARVGRHLPRRPGAVPDRRRRPHPLRRRGHPGAGGAHYGETPKVHGLAALPHLQVVHGLPAHADRHGELPDRLQARGARRAPPASRQQGLGGQDAQARHPQAGPDAQGDRVQDRPRGGLVPDPDHGQAAAHRRDRVGQARDRAQAAQAQARRRPRRPPHRWAPTCSRCAAPTPSAAPTPASAPAAPATPTRARTSQRRRAPPWWPRTPAP